MSLWITLPANDWTLSRDSFSYPFFSFCDNFCIVVILTLIRFKLNNKNLSTSRRSSEFSPVHATCPLSIFYMTVLLKRTSRWKVCVNLCFNKSKAIISNSFFASSFHAAKIDERRRLRVILLFKKVNFVSFQIHFKFFVEIFFGNLWSYVLHKRKIKWLHWKNKSLFQHFCQFLYGNVGTTSDIWRFLFTSLFVLQPFDVHYQIQELAILLRGPFREICLDLST